MLGGTGHYLFIHAYRLAPAPMHRERRTRMEAELVDPI